MTLNDLERRNDRYIGLFEIFTEFAKKARTSVLVVALRFGAVLNIPNLSNYSRNSTLDLDLNFS